MKGIDKKLFSDDGDWLKGSYSDVREMFGSFEYFAKYIKKRFPSRRREDIEDFRSLFLIEVVEIIWRPADELDHVKIIVSYGSSTIKILVPLRPEYSEAEKHRIEDEYQGRYLARIKESHVRINCLLWYLLSEAKKAEIRQFFPEEIEVEDLHLFKRDPPR